MESAEKSSSKIVNLPLPERPIKAPSSKLVPLVALIVGLLVSLFIVEIFVRLFKIGQPAATWNDRSTGYFAPETATSLQDYYYSPQKAPGTLRIAVVGDSFTFGPYLQFDDTFPKRLERWFNLNKEQQKVEVINYGVPRYSTQHEIAVVERAIKEGADLILLQITLNDPEIKPYRPTGLLTQDKFGQAQLESWWFRHWKTLKLVVTRIYNFQSQNRYRDYFFNLFEGPKSWANFKNSVTKIVSLCKEKNIPLVATVFPLFGYPNDNNYPFRPIHQKISDLLDDQAVAHLDLFDSYKGIPLERMTVIPGQDRHPNEIGHRIAAEAMYTWLKQLKVLPDSIFAKRVSADRIGILLPPEMQNDKGN